MFSFIKGNVVAKEGGIVILESNKIGYEILLPTKVFEELPDIGGEICLYVKLILRENEVFFVGFLKEDEKKIFDLLLTVNGVGVKQALKILSELSVNQIREAIITQNNKIFANVKGIGDKIASRIILELVDKIKRVELDVKSSNLNEIEKKKSEVLMALKFLGYSDFESRKAVDEFIKEEELKKMPIEDIIKKILGIMSKSL